IFAGLCGLAILGIALRPHSPGPVRLWTKDMYLEQVQTSLREALAAYDSSPPAKEVSRARFDIAIRSLAAADRLPPEGWEDTEVYAALRESSAPLSRQLEGRDIVRIYQTVSERQPERRDTEIPSNPALTLPPQEKQEKREAKPAERGTVVREELASIVAEFGIDAREQALPASLLAEVERFVQMWTGKDRAYTERSRTRSQAHLEMIRAELRRNLLPEVFCYLPFIESGYQASIGSHAGAEGLWQFMPATARKYGLNVNDNIDERTNPQLATVAACKYINDLLATFGANAFDCAVAAYNKGEYGMVSCLRGVSWKSQWKFWDAAERKDGCLKQETVEYVPR
ncbi:MAG TPA: lytic transglycosylase domain-containing protein, partial [bacterium]|nr:lytic transglycosylase domain-containing protein [bacterium]